MIIATINNNRLFVQFSKLITDGTIQIRNESDFENKRKIQNSDFEMFDFPINSNQISVKVEIDGNTTKKILKINQR